MSEETKIQWCDSTVNPIMGCAGCELFPTPKKILDAIDRKVAETIGSWPKGTAKNEFANLIEAAFRGIQNPEIGHRDTISVTNIWHLRERFIESLNEKHGKRAAAAVEAVINREVTCYAAKLHLNKAQSLVNPTRGANPGYAATFEQVTQFEGRVAEAAKWRDLLGSADSDRPWIEALPRLIFVSDMGDAFSRKRDFPFLKHEVIGPATTEEGRRHLWLWLTKRPHLMAEFAEELDGLPANFCAMTTLTGPDRESLKRLADLRRVRASIRGLSLEPLWERIPPNELDLDGIDWVIVGGESGAKTEHSRPFSIEWAEELRDHCRRNDVAFFLKQLGRRPIRGKTEIKLHDSHGGIWDEWPCGALRIREFPKAFHHYRADEPTQKLYRRVRQGDLTPTEADDFKRLGRIVARFSREIIVAAEALREIRDRRLYRAKFSTFSAYCESVHEMSRQYANRLIKAAEVRAEMVPIVTELGLPEPRNESQLRALGKLESTEERIDVYQEAIEQAKSDQQRLTAKLLAEVIAQRNNERFGKSSAPTYQRSPSARISEALPLLQQLEADLKRSKIETELIKRIREALMP